ncbi:hypothetical protein [Methylobacterium aquaticum]|nr:hypothetical protein [Methylobacterium aquaticum]
MFQAGQIQKGIDQGNEALDQGYDRAVDGYGRAATTFGNLADSYGSGSKLYQDALGVNGQGAADAARGKYQTSAGYGFNMDQGLQALQRTRAVNGTLASGNADTDAMKFASGLASQDYGNWLANLSNLDTKRFGATGAQAGSYGQIGAAGLTTGGAKANLDYQGAVGIGNAGAQGLMAGQQAAQNRFGLMMGGLNLFSQAAGSLAGNGNALGNIGKNLGSAFSIFG